MLSLFAFPLAFSTLFIFFVERRERKPILLILRLVPAEETLVSCLGNNSFLPVKQKFPRSETVVSSW